MQEGAQSAREGVRAHALLVGPVLAFFAPALFFGRALYLRDTGLYFYPHKALIARALREGRLPQWNPFEFGGVPLLADPNFNVFHPLSLLTWALPLPLGFTLFVAACALVAAYGARALARSLGASPSGALVAGLAYAWCGPFVSFIESGQCVAPAFLPWLCASGVWIGAAASGSTGDLRRSAARASLCAALVFLSGTPEIGACALGLASLLALASAQPGFRVRALAWVSFAVVLGAGLACVQLLPSAEFLRHSSRGAGFDFQHATSFSLHPLRLPGLLFPFFAGELAAPGTPQWLLDPGTHSPYVQEIYVGGLVLALAALSFGRDRGARPRLALAVASAGLLVLALGSHTPLYRALLSVLPPLKLIRFPEKLVVPAGLSLAVLAGAGWDRLRAWSAGPPRGGGQQWSPLERRALVAAVLLGAGAILALALSLHPRAFVAQLGAARAACLRAATLPSIGVELGALALGVLSCLLRARGRLAPRAWGLALAALFAVELGVPAARLDYTVPAAELTEPAPLAAILREDAGAPLASFRVSVQGTGLAASELDALLDPAWPRPRKLFRLRHLSLYDAGAALAGVYVDRGYSGFTPGPLHDLYVRNGKAVLDLLGVRYGVEFGREAPFYARLGFAPRLSALSGRIRVFHNPSAREKLRFVDAVVAPRSALLPLPPCQERDAVWLAPGDAEALRSRLALPTDCAGLGAPVARGAARILRYLPEEIEGEVDAPAPGLAVLGDTWDPGWQVFVDGARSASLAADGALRGVFVPAGRHRVRWTYRAPGLAAGAAMSLLAACAWIALALGARQRRNPAEAGR